jgi:hypothetical protein
MTGWLLSNRINNSTGDIEYLNFGCDSDADYGRTIDLFATAVRYSGACARGAGSMMGHGGVGGGHLYACAFRSLSCISFTL